ncbi:MAG TPA: GntR family transcriptional regulator [Firmicutes bacterium]|jgi:DNA-binding GntR family transcriptional regulator|nr:GntR family transcriptional regulator [Bacillota bacterium]HBK69215.1 GntR family transcriptional regulator [Bacillota bacterium]HBT15792.1 GntR family transcriptional regulator [Bacillota bacterium]
MGRTPLVPIKLDSYKPLRELVFEVLREAIISGQLAPGERLMEIQLAEELGVSRTPVREAIRKLELEELVLMVPRKGAYVASLSMKDVVEVFEIRGALEGLAAALAAERITEEELESLQRQLVKSAEMIGNADLQGMVEADTGFHQILYQASRNERLAQIINNLREQIQRFRQTSLSYPGRMKIALEEHREIVDAVSARDPEMARKLAQDHIENAENSMMQVIRDEKS